MDIQRTHVRAVNSNDYLAVKPVITPTRERRDDGVKGKAGGKGYAAVCGISLRAGTERPQT